MHFKACDELKQTKAMSFQKIFALEIIASLDEQLTLRFKDFHNHLLEIKTFSESIFIRNRHFIWTDANGTQWLAFKRYVIWYVQGKDLVKFYKCLLCDQFPNIMIFTCSMITIFGSICLSEKTFSKIKYTKSKLQSKLTTQ